MAQNTQIISGWKSIAAHFGRERTTVVRWAQERGLPVHRIPGGRIAKVFAYPCELDHWFESGGTVNDPAPREN